MKARLDRKGGNRSLIASAQTAFCGTKRAPTASSPEASTTTPRAIVNDVAVAMLPISGGPIMKPL